jgi:hypothetical protein
MKWFRICAAHGRLIMHTKFSVRKLERKRQSGGRRRLREDSFKTDPELGVTVRSVLMSYRTECSSGYSVRVNVP